MTDVSTITTPKTTEGDLINIPMSQKPATNGHQRKKYLIMKGDVQMVTIVTNVMDGRSWIITQGFTKQNYAKIVKSNRTVRTTITHKKKGKF